MTDGPVRPVPGQHARPDADGDLAGGGATRSWARASSNADRHRPAHRHQAPAAAADGRAGLHPAAGGPSVGGRHGAAADVADAAQPGLVVGGQAVRAGAAAGHPDAGGAGLRQEPDGPASSRPSGGCRCCGWTSGRCTTSTSARPSGTSARPLRWSPPWPPACCGSTRSKKAFASTGAGPDAGRTDGGLSQRMFGMLLTWMQDHADPVFMVATANDVAALPPELLRKGRFDEIFFVDLPDCASRRAIFEIHLARRGATRASSTWTPWPPPRRASAGRRSSRRSSSACTWPSARSASWPPPTC